MNIILGFQLLVSCCSVQLHVKLKSILSNGKLLKNDNVLRLGMGKNLTIALYNETT